MKLNCQNAARLLSEKRDRRLPWRVRISLRLHMFVCRMCQVYGAQLSAVNRVCREAGASAERAYQETLPDERKQLMKEKLERSRTDQ